MLIQWVKANLPFGVSDESQELQARNRDTKADCGPCVLLRVQSLCPAGGRASEGRAPCPGLRRFDPAPRSWEGLTMTVSFIRNPGGKGYLLTIDGKVGFGAYGRAASLNNAIRRTLKRLGKQAVYVCNKEALPKYF